MTHDGRSVRVRAATDRPKLRNIARARAESSEIAGNYENAAASLDGTSAYARMRA